MTAQYFDTGSTCFFACESTSIARLSHRNSVCLSDTRVDQSKMVQARFIKFSLLAAWSSSFRKAFPYVQKG